CDGSHIRLGTIRDRPADGGRAGEEICVQQRRYAAVVAHFQAGDAQDGGRVRGGACVQAAWNALLLEAHSDGIAGHRGWVVLVDGGFGQDRRVISARWYVERAGDRFQRMGEGVAKATRAGGGGRLQV